MRSFSPGRIPSTRRRLLLALVLLASSGMAFGQQVTVNSTPGLGGANHTVFVYDPYAWAFKGNDIAPVVKKHVAGGGAASGQHRGSSTRTRSLGKATLLPTTNQPQFVRLSPFVTSSTRTKTIWVSW